MVRSSETTIPGFLTDAVKAANSAGLLNPWGALTVKVTSPSRGRIELRGGGPFAARITTGESARRPAEAFEFATSKLRPPGTACSWENLREIQAGGDKPDLRGQGSGRRHEFRNSIRPGDEYR